MDFSKNGDAAIILPRARDQVERFGKPNSSTAWFSAITGAQGSMLVHGREVTRTKAQHTR
jgi:hypothetical protein